MNPRHLIARLALLSSIVIVFGTATVVFAHTALSPLAPAETYNGTLIGRIESTVSSNARFIITATALLSDNVQTAVYTAVVGTGPFTLTNVASGDSLGGGYGGSVSSASLPSPAPFPTGCYPLKP